MNTLQIIRQLSDEELDKLVSYATIRGYIRVSPDKTWGLSEKKDAARFAVNIIVNEFINSRE